MLFNNKMEYNGLHAEHTGFRHNKHTHTNQKAATDKHSRHNH